MMMIEHSREDDGLLLPYQKKWIFDGSRLKLMEKSRQIGMTWTAAYNVVREACRSDAPGDFWIASRDELQGRLFVEDCAAWAKILHKAALYWRSEVLVKEGVRVDAVRFASGREVHSLSSSENSQAGKRGTRILDEFALHADPRHLFAIAAPGVTWGGRIEILSTHRGSGNYFNTLVREAREEGNPKGISLHRVTLQDAVEQGLLRKLKKKLPEDDPRVSMSDDEYLQFVKDGCPDEESWREEYCCIPSDDSASFLPMELIGSAEYASFDDGIEKYPPWDVQISDLKRMKGAMYIGVDVGRERDLTVMWLLEVVGEKAFTRKLVCLDRAPFAMQEDRLYELMSLPCVRRCCIDETGIGRQFAERAAQKFGERRVEGVTLTAPLKEELAYPVKTALENGSLKLPPTDGVRADLRSVRRECASGGGLRFTAEHGKYGHADRFWALALALRAARQGVCARPFRAVRFGMRESIVI